MSLSTVLFFFLLFFFLSFFSFLSFTWESILVHSFIYGWWNKSFQFLSFLFWMHIIPIFRKGRRKNSSSCTYLCEGYFSGSFLLRASGILQNLAEGAFLISSVQRFCSTLSRSLAKSASISCQCLSRTKDPFPNFLWRKGIIFGAKGSGQSFGFFFFFYFLRSCYYSDLNSLLCPTDYRSWSAGSFWPSFWPGFVTDHGVRVIWLSFIYPF